MMRCSIPIMATGNKCVILCPPASDAMFPFQETLSCLLPAGDMPLLERVLKEVTRYSFDDVIVLAPYDARIEQLAENYHAHVREWRLELPFLLHEELESCERMLIVYGDAWMDHADVMQLKDAMDKDVCAALIRKYERYDHSGDGFGVCAKDTIEAIYGHPREHYVNACLCKAYVWNKQMSAFAKHCQRGFHHVNCGQMPDDAYYLEEAMQCAIEHGVCFQSVYCKEAYARLQFPWDIALVNELCCRQIAMMTEDHINKDTVLDDSVRRYGFLKTGEDVVIQDGVIFEGNCRIGNHVRIEKGAIIGRNCIINDGSVIGYQCRIHDDTVIGTNNKIGYHAEMCGVTFDGVCAVHGCEVFGIIGNKVDIAAGVQMAILRFDDTYVTQSVQGRRYSTPYTNRICIGDYCRTGVGNIFLPGVKVGSRSAIGPGVVVEKDIEANSLVLLKQETIVKQWGSNRYGW